LEKLIEKVKITIKIKCENPVRYIHINIINMGLGLPLQFEDLGIPNTPLQNHCLL